MLYVSTSEPSDTFVAVDGAKDVHKTLVMFNKLPGATQKIIKPSIQRNAFFAHPEPPLTARYSDEFIERQIQGKGKLIIESYLCHTQAVEQAIKLVTEASSSVCGENSRDGFIRAKLASRPRIPKFETKSQYAL